MSDGCDNQWSKAEIFRAMEALAPKLGATTVVEYGDYADRPVLSRLAEIGGGALVYAADFEAYEPVFEAALRRAPAAKKLEVRLGVEPIGGFAFAVQGDQVVPFALVPNPHTPTVHVPDQLNEVYFLSPSPVGSVRPLSALAAAWAGEADPDEPRGAMAAAYAAAHLFALRVKPKVVRPVLRALGDVRFIEAYANCLGKQRITAFAEMAREAATRGGWFQAGYDPERAPREDAFTILDLFELLQRDPRCRILTESPAWKYTRIGRRSVTKDQILTVEEADQVAAIADEIGESAAKLKAQAPGRSVAELRATWLELGGVHPKLAAILDNRRAALRFVPDPVEAACGYPVDELVWNATMPNLSVRVKKTGSVDLSGVGDDVPAEVRAQLPAAIETVQFRAYTVVKDGLVHLERLPVFLTDEAAQTLVDAGVLYRVELRPSPGGVEAEIDLTRVPVINQRMILDTSARDLAEQEWKLLELKAAAKVFGYYAPEKPSRLAERFGAPAAAWLAEQGVGDGGFNPRSLQAPSVDFNVGRALKTVIPGFSSLPKVEDVRAKVIAKGKLTPSAQLMAPAVREVEAYVKQLAAEAEQREPGSEPDQEALAAWLLAKERETTKAKREVERRIARAKFALLIGGAWFTEFASLDEKQLTLTLGGESRTVTFDLDENVKLPV